MPDFTLETAWQCESLESHTAAIGGYTQTNLFNERAYPHCTCPAYKFGKRTVNFGGQMVPPICKHIAEAEKTVCGWHSIYSSEPMTEPGKCPKCGKGVVSVRVAV